jgi:hypothetical protein
MGILDNIFVLNCDFNEHQSIEDLKALGARVSDELALIKPRPDLSTPSRRFLISLPHWTGRG